MKQKLNNNCEQRNAKETRNDNDTSHKLKWALKL